MNEKYVCNRESGNKSQCFRCRKNKDETGIYARTAGMLVKEAKKYESKIMCIGIA